jgi:hypothetical protein
LSCQAFSNSSFLLEDWDLPKSGVVHSRFLEDLMAYPHVKNERI